MTADIICCSIGWIVDDDTNLKGALIEIKYKYFEVFKVQYSTSVHICCKFPMVSRLDELKFTFFVLGFWIVMNVVFMLYFANPPPHFF